MSTASKIRATAGAAILAVLLSGCASTDSSTTTEWTAPREPLSEAQLEAILNNPDVSKIAPAHQRVVMELEELGRCPKAASTGSICADLGALNEAEGRMVYRCTAQRVCARDPFPIPCGEDGC